MALLLRRGSTSTSMYFFPFRSTNRTLSYTKDLNLWHWFRIVFNCICCPSGLVLIGWQTLLYQNLAADALLDVIVPPGFLRIEHTGSAWSQSEPAHQKKRERSEHPLIQAGDERIFEVSARHRHSPSRGVL